jgi:hypothetical protein
MSQSLPRGSRHFGPYRHPMHLERNRAQASGRRRPWGQHVALYLFRQRRLVLCGGEGHAHLRVSL